MSLIFKFLSDKAISLIAIFTFIANQKPKEQIISLKKPTDVREFTSPNYPLPYPLMTDFIYKLTIAAGHRIQINVQDIKLDSSPLLANGDCTESNDYLEVRDGPESTSKLIGKICRDIKVVIVATSNWLWLKLHSNQVQYTRIEKGFRAVISRYSEFISFSFNYSK